MAKKSNGYRPSIRNRGEDIGAPKSVPYNYSPNYTAEQRPIRRREIRERYTELNKQQQERDQRSFDRVMDAENEFYAGIDPRRRKEVADAGMIREDHKAIANLSPVAIHREYPKAGYYSTQYWDDLMRGGALFSDDNNTLL